MSTLTAERKAEIVAQFGANPQDTGNTRVQVALLTARRGPRRCSPPTGASTPG